MISITLNIMFLTDETMQKLYIEDDKYSFSYRIPKIIYSAILTTAISCFLELLVNISEQLVEVKNNISDIKQEVNKNENKNEEIKNITSPNFTSDSKQENSLQTKETNEEVEIGSEKKIELEKIKKCFNIRKYIFYGIAITFGLIAWYFVSCFFAVFRKTQYSLFKDILFDVIFNIIICFFKCLIILVFKIWAINIKFLICFNKAFCIINFIIVDKILEILIMLIGLLIYEIIN